VNITKHRSLFCLRSWHTAV